MFIIDKKEKLVKIATDLFIESVRSDSTSKFILPTGNAPIEMYENICEANKNGKIDLSNISTFNLDEYVQDKELNPTGIALRNYMVKRLFYNTNINEDYTHFPTDVDEFNYKLDQAGKVSIAYLGLGENGHIGFNEPGSDVIRTNVATLTETTRKAIGSKNGIDFEKTPTIAFTMGLKDIIEKSDKLVILAWGETKRTPLLKLKESIISDEVDKNWPVTNLIKHKNLIILTDQWLD